MLQCPLLEYHFLWLLCSHTCKLSHTHTHTQAHTLQCSLMVLPIPLPVPLSLRPLLPCAYSEKCNGFTRFVNVVGLKLCTVFCLCFALSLQSSEVSWVFYVSSSYCFLNILLLLLLYPCLRLTCMKKKSVCYQKKKRNAGCWIVFDFFLYFRVPFTSLSLPSPLNGMKQTKKKASTFCHRCQ